VELRESDEIASPAVAGWFRPIILLPSHWPTWSAAERRAVLAHELTHVARGDYAAGLLALAAAAVHFANPLAHWLVWRLRLNQELAADARASGLVGGAGSYAVSLAGVLLAAAPPARALPAPRMASGRTLSRRINMLRKAKRVPEREPSGRRRLLVLALVVGLAAGLSTVRLPAADGPPAPAPAAEEPLPAFDLTYLPDGGARGVVAFRPAETVRQANLTADHVKEANTLFRSMIALAGGTVGDDAPPDPTELDQVIVGGRSLITIADEEKNSSVAVGDEAMAVCVRTAKPFPWAERVAAWFPKAERAERSGRKYARIPAPPSFGPGTPKTLCLFSPDGRTLVMTVGEDQIKVLLDRLKAGTPVVPPPGWDAVRRDFAAVVLVSGDGGWARTAEPGATLKDPLRKDLLRLAGATKAVAIGLTVGERSGLRTVAIAKTDADAAEAEKAIRNLVAAARSAISEESKTEPDSASNRFLAGLADGLVVDRDGQTVRVRAERSGNLARLIAADVGRAEKSEPPKP
jgi:hypothetical protein